MIRFNKSPDRDFIILNLSDPQVQHTEWAGERGYIGDIFKYTVQTLIDRVKPDLITVSGDITSVDSEEGYRAFADVMDAYGIPWAPVWGNHDVQRGYDALKATAENWKQHPLCRFEEGDPALGLLNYTIGIYENGVPVAALLMLDSHDRVNAPGEPTNWACLYPEQLPYIEKEAAALADAGFTDATVMMHIPPYGMRTAYASAIRPGVDFSAASLHGDNPTLWREDADARGYMGEPISSVDREDGACDAFARARIIRRVLFGHDHVNTFAIRYKNVLLSYAAKTGIGCYANPPINGGTVLRVGTHGVTEMHHEWVDIVHLLPKN